MHRTFILIGLLLAGCASAPTGGDRVSTAQSNLPLAAPTLTALSPVPDAAQPAVEPMPTAQSPAEPPTNQEMTVQNGAWQVTLYSPDEVETSTQPYELKGAAPAGTVVSVNEQVLVVDSSGTFSVNIPLEEGPNFVEVIASNSSGEEADFLLTISYNP